MQEHASIKLIHSGHKQCIVSIILGRLSTLTVQGSFTDLMGYKQETAILNAVTDILINQDMKLMY